jgi:polyisoprenyl-phosphate glycosyltransferase
MTGDQSADEAIVVLLPLYNDWDSLRLLLAQLDAELARKGIVARALVVDDGSPDQPADLFSWGPFESLARVEVLTLRRNLGHQRAIAIGLAYVADHIDGRCVVVMDSDGEDSPADVPRLLARFDQEAASKIVFAERTSRSESLIFMVFYLLYKWLHFLLTGVHVRV